MGQGAAVAVVAQAVQPRLLAKAQPGQVLARALAKPQAAQDVARICEELCKERDQ